MNKIINSMIDEKAIWIGAPLVYLLIFFGVGGTIALHHPISVVFIIILVASIIVNVIYKTNLKSKN